MIYRKFLTGTSVVAIVLLGGVLQPRAPWPGSPAPVPCAGPETEPLAPTGRGGDLRVYLHDSPDDLHPYPQRLAGAMVTDVIFDHLLERDPDDPTRYHPGLAIAWRRSDDLRTLDFTLRSDVLWHDGRAFTAGDVKFTFDHVLARQDAGAVRKKLIAAEATCEAVDRHTVRFRFGRPISRLLDLVAEASFAILPRHKLAGADVESFARFGRAPVGTGAYRFEAWDGSRIRLRRNDAWWGKKPAFTAVTFQIYRDPTPAVSDLKSGALDFMPRLRSATFFDDLAGGKCDVASIRRPLATDGAAFLPDRTHERLRLGAFSSSLVTFIAWNCRRGPTAEPPVRRALAHLLDRLSLAPGSVTRVATGFRPKLSEMADRNLVPYPFDPKRAAEILRAAGWIDRDRDHLLDRDGETLSIRLVCPARSSLTQAKQLQSAARKIGIDFTVEAVSRERYGELRKQRKFDGLYAALAVGADEDPFPIWHSTGELNYAGFDEVDALVETIRAEPNASVRCSRLRELHGRVHLAQPILFVDAVTQLAAWDKRLVGVRFHPLKPFGWNLLEWRGRQ